MYNVHVEHAEQASFLHVRTCTVRIAEYCYMYVQVNVYKDPVTDHGKMSRKGRMTLELDSSGQYITRTEGSGDPEKVP